MNFNVAHYSATHIHRWYKQFMTYWAQTCEICRCSLCTEEIHVDLKRSSICTRRYIEINVLLARQTYIVAVNVNKFIDRLYWSNQQTQLSFWTRRRNSCMTPYFRNLNEPTTLLYVFLNNAVYWSINLRIPLTYWPKNRIYNSHRKHKKIAL